MFLRLMMNGFHADAFPYQHTHQASSRAP